MSLTVFVAYVLVLALLLVYPVSRWIWVLSVRRLQRKLKRELSTEEQAGQWRRALVIGSFICLVFSFLFNSSTVGFPQ